MQETRAIVLRAVKYDDNRMVVSLFSLQYGMIAVMMRAGRKRRNGSCSATSQQLALLNMEVDYRSSAGIQRATEISIASPWSDLPYHPMKASIAIFLAEFLHHALRSEGQNTPAFAFLEYSLRWLDEAQEGFANFHLLFMLRLTRFLGIWPSMEGYAKGKIYDLCAASFSTELPPHGQYVEADEAQYLPLLLRMDYSRMQHLHLDRNKRWHMLALIVRYYQLHVPGFGELHSMSILREMFS